MSLNITELKKTTLKLFKSHLSLLKKPDYVTIGGFVSAVIATFCILDGKFLAAYIFILGQIGADFADGYLARKMKRAPEKNIGVQLDSFSDFYNIVNTTLLLYFMSLNSILLYLVLTLFLLCGMLRLGRFNTLPMEEDGEQKYFCGLPTTGATFLLSTLLILNNNLVQWNEGWFLLLYVLVSLAMVADIKVKKWMPFS